MITSFLLSCSGANREILKQCPFEKAKYIGIGLTNLLIAILSSVSVGFFVSFAFTNKQTGRIEVEWYYLLAVCIIWGLLIFNLDRSIIISIRKTGTRLQQFFQALPRILIAVFIGIVISTPLELKIFSDEISVQMEKNLKNDIREMKGKNSQTHSGALKRADSVLQEQQKILKEKEDRRNQLYNSFIGEAEGSSGTGKKGKGPVFKEKKEQYDLACSQYNLQLETYNRATRSRDSVQERIRETDSRDETIVNNVNGPAAQIEALYGLTGVHLFVTLLFILLETMPVIVKLMSRKGLYDEILERTELETRLKEEIIIADKTSKRDYALKEIDEKNEMESELNLTRYRRRFAREMKTIDEDKPQQVPTGEAYNSTFKKDPPAGDESTTGNPKPAPVTAEEPASTTVNTPEKKAEEDTPASGDLINEAAEEFSFENKTWKEQGIAGESSFRFIRDEKTKKLLRVDNNIEKTGSWEYDPEQNLLVMDMDGSHREYRLISESPMTFTLQSLMGKILNLTSV